MDKVPALVRLDEFTYRIDPSEQPGMRVPGILFSDDALLSAVSGDPSLGQLANVATLPGIQRHALAMPDIHFGYGFPVGGVAAFDLAEGVVSPGGSGTTSTAACDSCGPRSRSTRSAPVSRS